MRAMSRQRKVSLGSMHLISNLNDAIFAQYRLLQDRSLLSEVQQNAPCELISLRFRPILAECLRLESYRGPQLYEWIFEIL